MGDTADADAADADADDVVGAVGGGRLDDGAGLRVVVGVSKVVGSCKRREKDSKSSKGSVSGFCGNSHLHLAATRLKFGNN